MNNWALCQITKDSSHKSINVIYHISKIKRKKQAFLNKCKEKAFDNIQYQFMIKLLNKRELFNSIMNKKLIKLINLIS